VNAIQRRNQIVQETLDMWGIDLPALPATAQRFFNEWKAQKKELLEIKKGKALLESELLEKKMISVGKVKILAEKLSGDAEYLSQLIFTLTAKNKDLIILLIEEESLFMAIGAGKKAATIFSSNDLLKETSKVMGGSGGGKADFARGSGKEPNKIPEAIAKFKLLVESKK